MGAIVTLLLAAVVFGTYFGTKLAQRAAAEAAQHEEQDRAIVLPLLRRCLGTCLSTVDLYRAYCDRRNDAVSVTYFVAVLDHLKDEGYIEQLPLNSDMWRLTMKGAQEAGRLIGYK